MKHGRITVLLLAFIAFAVSLSYDRQISIYLQIHRSLPLDILFTTFTYMGSMIAVLFIITSICLWQKKQKGWIIPFWLSLGFTAVIGFLIKLLVARPRPAAIGIIAVIAGTGFSFPSLHAAAAFSALPVMDRQFRALKIIWIIAAIMIAFSRVYLSVHYMSDVIAGGMIGYCIGWLFAEMKNAKWFRKLNFLER